MKSLGKILFFLAPSILFANQTKMAEIENNLGFQYAIIGFLGFVFLILVFLLIKLIEIYYVIENQRLENEGLGKSSFFETLYNKIWVGEQNIKNGEVLLPHSFDGIGELNNSMPPWLRYVFVSTIVFAVAYLSFYYVFEAGTFQKEEYEIEIASAKESVEAYLAQMQNAIDENSVVANLNDKASLEKGKAIFTQNCKACHGANGQGGIGPNLTDAYWLHGGKINDIFKTIKFGIPEKGMISWKQKLKPIDIQDVSNYIMSIRGSNPENQKSAEGNLEQ